MSPTEKLQPGLTGRVEVLVTEEKTAPVVGSGHVAVFATPMMVAAMEGAACAAIDKYLPDTHTSVGLKIDANHTAATPVGLTVTATATLQDVSGRKLVFSITAHDGHDTIGSAKHTRVVVDYARFEAGLRDKRP